MRAIFFLLAAVGLLILAGVITINWSGSSATVNFDKDKAKERAHQVLEEVKTIEQKVQREIESDSQPKR